jgi:glucose-6-phosphate dehydrogenase assembly protein OpcA
VEAVVSGIDVQALLGELGSERGERGGISTTSLNVIAFVEDDPPLLDWMADSGDRFAESHGSRIILLDASCGCEKCSVRAHSSASGDTVVTRSEQIRVGVDHVPTAELRSAVHALLVPNVRTVLFWAGDLRDPRFAALSELCELIVLFSPASASGAPWLQEVIDVYESPMADRVRDLCYMRLMPWQDLIAQFFDDPELAAELPTISQVDVITGSESEAYYLIGWLASRLNWEPCGTYDFCNAQGQTVRVRLKQDGLPRRIRSVHLQSASCTFGVRVSEDLDDLICLTVEGRKARPSRCVPLHDVDIVSLVERAIFSAENRAVFRQTLAMVRRLLDAQAQT